MGELSDDEKVLHIMDLQKGHTRLVANEKKIPLLKKLIEHHAMLYVAANSPPIMHRLCQGEVIVVALLGTESPQSYKALTEYYHVQLTLQIDERLLEVICELTDHHVYGTKVEAIEIYHHTDDTERLEEDSNTELFIFFKSLMAERLLHFGDVKAENEAPLTQDSWEAIKRITLKDDKAVIILEAIQPS